MGFCRGTSYVRPHAHEEDLPRIFVFVAVGIGSAIGIDNNIGRTFSVGADSDPIPTPG